MVNDFTVRLTRNELKSLSLCEPTPYSMRDKVIDCILQTFDSMKAISADPFSECEVLSLIFRSLREEDVRISDSGAIRGVEFRGVDAE